MLQFISLSLNQYYDAWVSSSLGTMVGLYFHLIAGIIGMTIFFMIRHMYAWMSRAEYGDDPIQEFTYSENIATLLIASISFIVCGPYLIPVLGIVVLLHFALLILMLLIGIWHMISETDLHGILMKRITLG